MLTISLLLVSSLIALKRKNIARWLALFSLFFFNKSFSFEWLPGITFSWTVSSSLIFPVFLLIIASSIFYSQKLDKTQTSMILLLSSGILGFLGSSSPFQLFFFLELMLFPTFYLIRKEDSFSAFKYSGPAFVLLILSVVNSYDIYNN